METSSQSRRFWIIVIGGLALGFAFFLIAGLVFGLDYWWRGRPEYSLNQIGVAVQTHNLHLFRKHVDTKAISGRLIDDLINLPTDSTESPADQTGQALGQALVGLMKPRIVEAFEEQIERYVETGSFNSDKSKTAIDTQGLKDIADRLGSFDWATIDGNVATTQIEVIPETKGAKTVTLGLKLRRTEDGFWQLMEISVPKEILDQGRNRTR